MKATHRLRYALLQICGVMSAEHGRRAVVGAVSAIWRRRDDINNKVRHSEGSDDTVPAVLSPLPPRLLRRDFSR